MRLQAGARAPIALCFMIILLFSSIGLAYQSDEGARAIGSPTFSRIDAHHETAFWNFSDMAVFNGTDIMPSENGIGLATNGTYLACGNGWAMNNDRCDQFGGPRAFNSKGHAVMAWQDFRNGMDYDIFGRIYNVTTGVQIGEEFVICNAPGNQSEPVIAVDSHDNIIAFWDDERPGSDQGVHSRSFDPNGAIPSEDIFVCNTAAVPSIAIDSKDRLVVVWLLNAGFDKKIEARIFNSTNGTEIICAIPITSTTSYPWSSQMAINSKDDFIVAWHNGTDISAAIYDIDTGQKICDDIFIPTMDNVICPSAVAVRNNDDFIIAWGFQNGTIRRTWVNVFNSTSGKPIGGDILVNEHIFKNGQNFGISVAAIKDRFLVAWDEYEDSSGEDIYATIFNATTCAKECNDLIIADATGNQWIYSMASNFRDTIVISWAEKSVWGDYDAQARTIDIRDYYAAEGSFITSDHSPTNLVRWLNISHGETIPNSSGNRFEFSYSIDSGIMWTPIDPDGNISTAGIESGRIRFRISLATEDNTTTPVIHNLTLSYFVNVPPSIDSFPPGGATSRNQPLLLSAMASDPDDDSLTFSWSLDSPAGALLMSSSSQNATFISSRSGNYTVRFIVSDGYATAERTVEIEVLNHPPIILGPDSLILLRNEPVTLPFVAIDGDNDTLACHWEFVQNPINATMANASTISPTITATRTGNISLRLFVSDGEVERVASLKITVVGHPPVAVIRADRMSIYTAGTIMFNASRSHDKDNDSLQFRFHFGDGCSTGWQDESFASHIYNMEGNLSASVDVRDSDLNLSTSDPIVISVLRPPDRPPSITIAYPAENARLKGTVQVRGTASKGSLPLSAVKVRVDNGTWATAYGLDHWTWTIDTAKLANGDHRVEAKAFDANLSSDTASVDFTIRNPQPGYPFGDGQWTLRVAIIAVAAGLCVFIFLRKK